MIIKAASYFIASMIVISSIVDKDTYRRIMIQLKKIGIMLAAIILLIVVSIVSYKVFKQTKNKKMGLNRSEAYTKDKGVKENENTQIH